LILCVSQYDAYVRAITITVYHIRPTKLFIDGRIVPYFERAGKSIDTFRPSSFVLSQSHASLRSRPALV
jgi:hypothetical protein